MNKTYLAVGGILSVLGAGGYVQVSDSEIKTYRNELVEQVDLNEKEAFFLYTIKDKRLGLIDIKPKTLQIKAVTEYTRHRDRLLGNYYNSGTVLPNDFHVTALYDGLATKERKALRKSK